MNIKYKDTDIFGSPSEGYTFTYAPPNTPGQSLGISGEFRCGLETIIDSDSTQKNPRLLKILQEIHTICNGQGWNEAKIQAAFDAMTAR